jgi:hypothetical protein
LKEFDIMDEAFLTLCKNVPHVEIEFLQEVVRNCDDSEETEVTNITGSPLSDIQMMELQKCLQYCQAVYTTTATKEADKIGATSVKNKIAEIKNCKERIEECCKALAELSQQYMTSIKAPLQIIGSVSLTVPISLQVKHYEDCYKEWKKTTNSFLKSCELKEIPSETIHEARVQLQQILDNFLNDQYDFYWTKTGEWTENAKIVCSFLSTAGLVDQKEKRKFTVLNVGFRNRAPNTGVVATFARPLINLVKHNPHVKFGGGEEVNYIAFLEEDLTPARHDILRIVFSGSNGSDDWVKNCTFGSQHFHGVAGHEGIFKIVQDNEFIASYETLLDRLNNHYNGKKPAMLDIVTTGHSLGAALALLTAYYHVKKPFEKPIIDTAISVKTILFGGPPILSDTSQTLVEEALGKSNIFRVWTFDDPVVRLSNSSAQKWLQDAVHVGTSYPLYNIRGHPKNPLADTSIIFADSHQTDCYTSHLSHIISPDTVSNEILEHLQKYLKGEVDSEYISLVKSFQSKNSWGRFLFDLVPVVGPSYNMYEHVLEGKYWHATLDGMFVLVDATTLGWSLFARGSAIKGVYKATQISRNVLTPVGRGAYSYVGKQGVNVMRRAGVGLIEGSGKAAIQSLSKPGDPTVKNGKKKKKPQGDPTVKNGKKKKKPQK